LVQHSSIQVLNPQGPVVANKSISNKQVVIRHHQLFVVGKYLWRLANGSLNTNFLPKEKSSHYS
jgi:hypothetical protein